MLSKICMIKENNYYTLEDIRILFPDQEVVVVDFSINGIENFPIRKGLYTAGLIANCDHHIPMRQFERVVSSTNLAIEYVNSYGILSEETIVVINHIDCDSCLASLILKGIIEADEKFGLAAIAADHTGEANPIADLLNSLQKFRDLEFSVSNLFALLANEELSEKVIAEMQTREKDREKAEEMVRNAELNFLDGVYYGTLEKKIDGAFLPALLPDAKMILIFNPLSADPTKLEVKARLGFSAPEGIHLNNLGMHEFDSAFGGRWNAGSNKRGGGTNLSPLEYAKEVLKRIS